VTDCVPELPTVTLPNARLPGITEIAGAAAVVAVPLTGMELGELGALLVKEMVPASVPTAGGVNFTLKLAVPLLGMVRGVLTPLIE
jgi:hypothetical protein